MFYSPVLSDFNKEFLEKHDKMTEDNQDNYGEQDRLEQRGAWSVLGSHSKQRLDQVCGQGKE